MTYSIVYDETGTPIGVRKGKLIIPLVPGNMDFEEFLKWNQQRSAPLDYKTPIKIIETPIEAPTIEERISAIEEKMKTLEASSEGVVKTAK